MFRFFQPSSPFYQLDGGSGGGAGAGDNGGSALTGGGNPASGGAGATSQVYELNDDALVKLPGAKDPIKFKDYRPQGYVPQSEYTKKTQEIARARAAFEQEKAQATQLLLEQAQRIAQSQGRQGGQPDFLSQLRESAYVDGNTAAQIVETIQSQGIQPIVEAIQQRDQALQLLMGHIQKQDQVLKQIAGRTNQAAFGEKVSKVRDTLGLPNDAEANEFLMDLYAAYEGNDLDQAIPEIARKRVEGLRRVFREMDKAAAMKARQDLIPGRGGSATPSQRLNQGYKSPQQIANELGAALGIPD